MNILIVAKTRMNTGLCVGGLVLDGNRSVRLLPSNGHNQPNDTPFEVGDIWDLNVEAVMGLIAPHVEDVRVMSGNYVGKQDNLSTFLADRVRIFLGSSQVLFDGLLRFTGNGSAYISQRTGVPNYSTCFWRTDNPIVKVNGKQRYGIRHPNRLIDVSYVGTEEALDTIPANTLVRLSLARWWHPDDSDMEERCYLQLSGWYNN